MYRREEANNLGGNSLGIGAIAGGLVAYGLLPCLSSRFFCNYFYRNRDVDTAYRAVGGLYAGDYVVVLSL